MLNQVLIVAPGAAARTPADVARSLQFTPVIAGDEEEAVHLLDRQAFTLIAVSGASAWRRVSAAAASKQPMTRVLELTDLAGDDAAIRRLMVRYLEPLPPPRQYASEERYRFLSSILESFTGTLELREVLRRIVTITREELGADRAWLLHPIHENVEYAKIAFSVAAPGYEGTDLSNKTPVPLTGSRNLIRRVLDSSMPIIVHEGDPDLDPELVKRFDVCSQMLQTLRPRDEEPWVFGLQHCRRHHEWNDEEVSLFAEIGRYATLALNNTLLHARAIREMAKVTAILDQIPESAAIYDGHGKLERMNAAAQREPGLLFVDEPEGRLRTNQHRYIDGSPLLPSELPSMRALTGDTVKSDYL
ncbi:MAG TPA: GAF domain-containing protein, partial [Thermoanaerobaculia bacterium]